MARIRTVKPSFFRHEALQDLEAAHPGKFVMLVFAGLWGHCDKAGRFEWRPRQLKLDILPFLPFDMGETLDLLAQAGFIRRYQVGEKHYGLVPSFAEHQRISGKEVQEPEKYPSPICDGQGSAREAPEKHVPAQEGNGEQEGKRNGEEAAADAASAAAPLDPKSEIFGDGLVWLKDRTKRSESSLRSWLGKCCGEFGDHATLAALIELRAQAPPAVDPLSRMRSILEPRKKSDAARSSPQAAQYAGFAIAVGRIEQSEADSGAHRDAAGPLLDAGGYPRIAVSRGG